MKTRVITAALFSMALPAFGQQSGTTNTNCQVNGNEMNCTTQHGPSWDETYNKYRNLFGKRDSDQPKASSSVGTGQLSPEAIKELLAENKKQREAKDTVDYIYCRQNAKASITDYEGKPKTCPEVIAYTKAFCLVNPNVERCTLAKSKAEVDKAFSILSEDYKTDPRRNKKDAQMHYDSLFAKLTRWGCMSFPDMTLPQRDGSLHPCPDATESSSLHVDPGPQAK